MAEARYDLFFLNLYLIILLYLNKKFCIYLVLILFIGLDTMCVAHFFTLREYRISIEI